MEIHHGGFRKMDALEVVSRQDFHFSISLISQGFVKYIKRAH